jgi:hypothetical protein
MLQNYLRLQKFYCTGPKLDPNSAVPACHGNWASLLKNHFTTGVLQEHLEFTPLTAD